MKKHSVGSLLFIALVLVIMYLPIIVVVVYSFNANTARIPIAFTGWTTAWYGKLFTGRNGFGGALMLSLRVALWSVGISCAIGTLGPWAWRSASLGKSTAGLIPSWNRLCRCRS